MRSIPPTVVMCPLGFDANDLNEFTRIPYRDFLRFPLLCLAENSRSLDEAEFHACTTFGGATEEALARVNCLD